MHATVKYEVKSGVVTLTGEVNSEEMYSSAEKVAATDRRFAVVRHTEREEHTYLPILKLLPGVGPVTKVHSQNVKPRLGIGLLALWGEHFLGKLRGAGRFRAEAPGSPWDALARSELRTHPSLRPMP
jgi:hypothetical protein